MLQAYEETMKRGCTFFYGANRREDEHGEVRSGIYTYGETVHIFVERKTIMVFSYQDIKNGNQIIIQKQQV
jgi:hypothetical protein